MVYYFGHVALFLHTNSILNLFPLLFTLLGFSSEGGGRRSAEETAGGGRAAAQTDNDGGSESYVLRVRFFKWFHFIPIRNMSNWLIRSGAIYLVTTPPRLTTDSTTDTRVWQQYQ